jgi:hypothetical protein
VGGDTLVVGHDPQLRPVLLRLQDRRLPLPRQILEPAGLGGKRGDVDERLGRQPITLRRYPQIATATSFQFAVGAVA